MKVAESFHVHFGESFFGVGNKCDMDIGAISKESSCSIKKNKVKCIAGRESRPAERNRKETEKESR